MSSNKQILVIIMSIAYFCDGYVLKSKREAPEAIASFFIDKASEGMAIIEHGAAYKGQQDHQLDFFGAQAGIDAKPKIGFGDAVREEDDDDDNNRKKRQAEADHINGGEENEDAQEIHGIFQEMWRTVVESGKKVIKKVAQMMDRDGAQGQEGQQPDGTY